MGRVCQTSHVLPLTPYRSKADRLNKNKLLFSLKQHDNLSRNDAPYLVGRGIFCEAKLSAIEPGVIVAQGGTTNGWAIYVHDAKLHFALTHEGQRQVISSPKVAGAGRVLLRLGKDGIVTLRWNGQQVGPARHRPQKTH